MSLTTSGLSAGTSKQKLKMVPLAPNICFVPAPPPPTGPQGIPAPFPITTDTGSIKKPVPKVKHQAGKVPNLDSTFTGVNGNQAGVGQLPPTTPKKDLVTGVNLKQGSAMVGCPNCQVGGKSFLMSGSMGFGNHG
ncbi:DUF4150 domain-containing protein [Myxococcus sp. K15C18031901]|uniref:PAAR-like domain-containing protein n=1 Tax=Myxococcus dinghuensis TaxID=2906761 RepID=UPI0020A7AB33|nr:PAAR-like domain-containing protein [Myxococcus dinghuensis]MCP3098221.1 DUF4150 domain-containing protein [Myxococcus dinghuensis]